MSLWLRRWQESVPLVRFALLHLSALAVFVVPFQWSLVGWLCASYVIRMFGVTAGYHRYFSHRSYKLGRLAQAALAVLAQTSGQKGVLWWAAHHRDHHRHADRERDVHSPTAGFWWAHVGWILSTRHDAYDPRRVADFGRFPELRWLDRYHWMPTVAFAGLIYAAGGFSAFVWGYLLATVLLYHATFAINSIAHIWGTRRFATTDLSRNNWWLALLTLGEGWHNNHHYCMSSARQGVRWWEIDLTYAGLRLLALMRVARDLRPFVVRPPQVAPVRSVPSISLGR
jgi:stearoyl-CoA desaturase (delta-9 desaturase)